MRLTSLPLQLLAFVVLPLLVLLMIVAFGGVALHQDEMREMLVNHNRETASGAAQSLSQHLEQRERLLRALAAAAAGDAAGTVGGAAWLAPMFDGGVALYVDGELAAATPSETRWGALGDELTSMNAPSFLLFTGAERSETRVAVIGSSGDAPQVRAIGLISLEALAADGLLESLHTSDSTDVYLLGPDGALLYDSTPSEGRDPTTGPSGDVVPAHAVEATEVKDAQGRDAIRTVAPVTAAGWTLVHEERWKETLSPLMRYSQAAPLTLVPAILIAVGAMWFGIQRIVYPLRRLEAQATELSWGANNPQARDVGGIAEIQRLQDTLRQMAARVQAAQASMHHYIGAITRAQEDERRRLARELHDQTAQALVALDHRQQMLKPYLKDDPAASALLTEVRSMIAATIDDLRRIVRALRPIYLEELGLSPALQMLARDVALDDAPAIHFEQTGAPQRLPPEHEMALYRIAQEALNNAWQHGEARHVWVTIKFTSDQVTVTVRDDGKGFHPPSHALELGESGRRHFGLMGMYERAALIGAALEVLSEPGTGTRVTVRAPIASLDSGPATAAPREEPETS